MPPQLLAAFLNFAGYPRLDVASPQSLATLPCVVGLIGVQLYRTLARATPTRSRDRLDGIHELFEDRAVVGVGGGENYRELDAVSVRYKVALGARLFPWSVGLLPVFCPPFGGYTRRIQRCSLPVDLVGLPEAVQEQLE